MSHRPTPLVLILATLLLAGCATTQPTAPAPVPPAAAPEATVPVSPPAVSAPVEAPPPAVTPAPTPPAPAAPVTPPPVRAVEAKPAIIRGSEESSAMLDSLTAYVAMVDGIPITAGRDGWDTPLTIKAGVRRVSVGFVRGVFTAKTDLQFIARSEGTYQVKFGTDAQLFGKNSYCEFWIVDTTTGQNATDRKRVPLTRIEASH